MCLIMSGYEETTVGIHKYKRIVMVINGNKEEEIALNLNFNVYVKNLLHGNNKLVTVHN